MYEPRCALCGVRCRSAGQNPPPSWWVDPLEPSLCLCEDCRDSRLRALVGRPPALENLRRLFGPGARMAEIYRRIEAGALESQE